MKKIPFVFINLSFLVGLFQNRQSFCLAFLYGLGRFHYYSWLQAFSPLLRFFLLAILLFFFNSSFFNLSYLIGIDLLSYGIGWMICGYSLNIVQKHLINITDSFHNYVYIPKELWRFVFPSLQAGILLSLAHTSGILFGALFATSTVVAIYSLFQKLNQIVMLAIGPINNYLCRRLRLMQKSNERFRKSNRYLFMLLFLYSFFLFLFLYYLYNSRKINSSLCFQLSKHFFNFFNSNVSWNHLCNNGRHNHWLGNSISSTHQFLVNRWQSSYSISFESPICYNAFYY
ncbi:hypothetical protein A946_00095 [Methylacidiphilum kamchatkense Kam1]|uniref:Uncharacterized protein n=1 Tax=Methylacidiphilum kamchatkense Kam1 TaxID=1202785 RepID=A0ABR4ZZH7_9BACT|nr:hypothetical protein A946_00095 [Methylacidiphilum kamchatkense Kam1]